METFDDDDDEDDIIFSEEQKRFLTRNVNTTVDGDLDRSIIEPNAEIDYWPVSEKIPYEVDIPLVPGIFQNSFLSSAPYAFDLLSGTGS